MKTTIKTSILSAFLVLGLCLACASCSSVVLRDYGQMPKADKPSRFMGENARPGMTKEEFLRRNGEPYKVGFSYHPNGDLIESLYYKESVGFWYLVNTVFHFHGGALVAQEQLDEERLYKYNGNNVSD